MGEELRIVTVDKENSSHLEEKILKSILLDNDNLKKRKIVPISVSGAMRTGKSFLLNYFLRYLRARYVSHDVSKWLGNEKEPLEGFVWGSSVERVTCGIIMWSEVFLYDSPEHGPVAIILMDTQGLFDNQSTQKDNSNIFALSTMMTSVQIFNVMGNINERDLEQVQFFATYGRVAVQDEFTKPFQKLTFLVRDWGSPQELPFGSSGGCQLLDKRMKGDSRLKSVRDTISRSFDSVDCFLMRSLGDKAADDPCFDGSIGYLHPKCVETLKTFVESILTPENLLPKRINGEIVTVAEYFDYFRCFAEFFGSNKLPAPENLTVTLAVSNALTAMKAAVEMYQKELNSIDENIDSIETLDQIQNRLKEKVLSFFDKETQFGREHTIDQREELVKSIDAVYVEIREKTTERLDQEETPITPEEFEKNIIHPLTSIFEALMEAIGLIFPEIGRALRDGCKKVKRIVKKVLVAVFQLLHK